MYAYKTNSADYLDYLASVMTREQILADPDKCFLLENEYIRDNMEIALRWNAAKNGGYAEKYEFVEYLMCNGVELDADTILHYRTKCNTDPVYNEIAYGYFNDGETVKKIRKEKYNKESDDCFSNPCFYLGRFSAVMGSLGDTKATYSPFNIIADWLNSCSCEKKAEAMYGQQLQQGLISQAEYDAKIQEAKMRDQREAMSQNREYVAPSGGSIPRGQEAADRHPSCGCGRPCFEGGIIPSVAKGWKMLMGALFEGNAEFCDELAESTNCFTDSLRTGDWMSPAMSEMLDLTSKANVKRHLGDCSRLWSQVRRLRLFGPENAYTVVSPADLHEGTNVDGTPTQPLGNPEPCAQDMTVTLNGLNQQPADLEEAVPVSDFLGDNAGDPATWGNLFPSDN